MLTYLDVNADDSLHVDATIIRTDAFGHEWPWITIETARQTLSVYRCASTDLFDNDCADIATDAFYVATKDGMILARTLTEDEALVCAFVALRTALALARHER